jgi:mono/diheme cytochrome c family protein
MKVKTLNIFKRALLIAPLAVITIACSKDPQSPGYEYMPDMYRSVAYDGYQKNPNFSNGTTAQQPVEGSMPYMKDRNKIMNVIPYPYPNTPEGYEAAASLVNPLPASEAYVKEGEAIYKNMCVHCHGEKGQGDGKIGQKNPALIPPAYNSPQLATLPEGKIFHSITWGKGMMGAHQYQITKLDRWKLVQYVQTLQKLPTN